MVWRKTILMVSDSCGATKSRCAGFFKKNNYSFSKVGSFVQVAVIVAIPRARKLKGSLRNAIFIRGKKNFSRADGSVFEFYRNNCALLKKRLTTYGKYISGPISYSIKRKRFISSFSITI